MKPNWQLREFYGDARTPIHRRNMRIEKNIVSAIESMQENPNLLIRRHSTQLGLYSSIKWKLTQKNLGLHPYKIQ